TRAPRPGRSAGTTDRPGRGDLPCWPGSALRGLGVDAEALDAAVQRAAVEPEDARRLGLVAADRGQHLADVAPLHLLEREQLVRVVAGDDDARALVVADLLRQIVDRDLRQPVE